MGKVRTRNARCVASILALSLTPLGTAHAQSVPQISETEEIVVTAQKRSEKLNDVGMSITASSGDQLLEHRVTDVSQLSKVVPGFIFNSTGYGTPVYTIRGVGFQESSLGASPAVSVYVDETPLPFSAETLGATLDLERVEVLKGPQGTFYGENSTGGAINYIAAKPLDHFSFGVDASYSRFNTVDLSGFVTGPLTDTLNIRLAARILNSGDWQRSISRDATLGQANQKIGRLLLDWRPTDRLKAELNINGWRDKSDTQATQLIDAHVPLLPPFPNAAYEASPLAPPDARAADWDPDKSLRQNTSFYQATGRIDYDIGRDTTLTSITSYSRYDRDLPVDTDGSAVQNLFTQQGGHTATIFQELRAAGRLWESGHWLVGLNYEDDKIFDVTRVQVFQQSQSILGATPVNEGSQRAKTKSVYANVDFPLADRITLLGGLRYTDVKRDYHGCTRDSGDGLVASSGFFPGATPGGCVTILEDGTLGEARNKLDEDNVSWRVGLNYKPLDGVLLYTTISKGWKSGSFPLLAMAVAAQSRPVTQESVLAYEVGAKAKINGNLQLNAAAFYYDYREKQIRGFGSFPPFGVLEVLVNVPKSRVVGFEANAVWSPMRGLTISPAITLVDSKILDNFTNYNPLGQLANFGGEAFPYTPRWSGNTDVEYRFAVRDGLSAFVGGNVSYHTKTNAAFGQLPAFDINGYTLLDLRAGVEADDGRWRASIWGQNVTNTYYWISTDHFSDGITRYAGRPATYGISFTRRY